MCGCRSRISPVACEQFFKGVLKVEQNVADDLAPRESGLSKNVDGPLHGLAHFWEIIGNPNSMGPYSTPVHRSRPRALPRVEHTRETAMTAFATNRCRCRSRRLAATGPMRQRSSITCADRCR